MIVKQILKSIYFIFFHHGKDAGTLYRRVLSQKKHCPKLKTQRPARGADDVVDDVVAVVAVVVVLGCAGSPSTALPPGSSSSTCRFNAAPMPDGTCPGLCEPGWLGRSCNETGDLSLYANSR